MSESIALARSKYQRAIKLIEQAETLLSEACGELCPLVGAIDQWKDCGDRYDEVRALSRRLAYSAARDNVDMDHD